MTNVSWAMSPRTIVRKVEDEPKQATLPDPHLKKVKEGERMRYQCGIDAGRHASQKSDHLLQRA